MSNTKFIDVILSEKDEIRNSSLDELCKNKTLIELLNECKSLENFRKQSTNLYHRVRSLFFLYAIHRFHIPFKKEIKNHAYVPIEAHNHLLKRRYEEAISILLEAQEINGPTENLSSALSKAYHEFGFQTLADQVKISVKSVAGNRWMFRVGHPEDHPLKIKKEILTKDINTGLYPLLKESTPVRMDLTHSGWSDIFFLGMDYPDGARVLNVSINLSVYDKEQASTPIPPVEAYFRIIDEPVIRLTSVDLKTTTDLTVFADIFDFAKDYLGLLKAAVIASGIVPPGMEGAGIQLSQLLEQLLGKGKGFELVSSVNNIPKGSRLAVSTNLLASLIAVCMRASGQTKSLTGALIEEERRVVAARAILGEWIGGSGGGWQDSGGVWPGIKQIFGVEAKANDPEFQISKGCLLPKHFIMEHQMVSTEVRKKLQDSLVIVHGGMAQDVGPILEMVTEKYLLRSKNEWEARKKALSYFDGVVDQLKKGEIKNIAKFTQNNFEGPIQDIIPWASNLYTETIIDKVKSKFGNNFWGFWMMGGMSGGGMGFMFEPSVKEAAKIHLLHIMQETKNDLDKAIAFGMNPIVYNFEINETGTNGSLLLGNNAILPSSYYNFIAPKLIRKEAKNLSPVQRIELEIVSEFNKKQLTFNSFVSDIFEQLIPQNTTIEGNTDKLNEILTNNGFDQNLHQQIKSDLKAGRIGLAQNRLSSSSIIEDVTINEINDSAISTPHEHQTGLTALKNGELAILTLAGGVGSRWTSGAGVVKSLNPFVKMGGKYRNFIDIHIAKNKLLASQLNKEIQHVFSTSFMTHDAIANSSSFNTNNQNLFLSRGKFIGQRLIPTERDLRFLWEEMAQQDLDEQAQKVRQSLRNALINWVIENGEANDYIQNLPLQCVHPVGHWFEFPNMLLNGSMHELIVQNSSLKYILIHNIDTLGANPDPAILGKHILSQKAMSVEVIKRNIDDHGGGLAKVNGRLRLIEGMALPNEELEFNLSYYNTNTFWVSIDDMLAAFKLERNDLNNQPKVKNAVLLMSSRMPSYVTVKDVKKRWGKGQEDIYPVMQFEKIWGDMTTLPEINCQYLLVNRNRGQQLKSVDQLDGWLRDGSAAYIDSKCKWE